MAADIDGTLLIDGQRILEDYYDEEFEPDETEIRNYCKLIGLDYEKEPDLVFIAVEGLKAPLPAGWKAVEEPGGEMYYFNFKTKQSQWEHPCDEFYKEMLERERAKLRASQRAGKASLGKKTTGLDLLPGASGLMRGVSLNLPPLRGPPHLGGIKSGALAQQKPTLGPGANQTAPSTGSRYLKSPVSAVSDASPTTGSPALGVGVSPDMDKSISPGLSYLKSSGKPPGTGGGSRSPAAFELGNNVAAQFEREDSVEEDDDDEEDSDIDDFNRKFKLEGIDAEELTMSSHDVSEEIAKVTGMEPEEDDFPPQHDSDESEDDLMKMKEYVQRLDNLSPGGSLGGRLGASYLKSHPKTSVDVRVSSGKHSEHSSGRSSGLSSPKRPSSSYGRQGQGGVAGPPIHHHIIPTQTVEMEEASEEDDDEVDSEEEGDEDDDLVGGVGTFSPPLTMQGTKMVEEILSSKFNSNGGPFSAVMKDVPPSAVMKDGPLSAVMKDGPPSAVMKDGPPSTVMKDGPPSAVMKDGPPSAVVKDGPPSAVMKDVPPSTVMKDGPPSAVMKDGPPSAVMKDRLMPVAAKDGERQPGGVVGGSAVQLSGLELEQRKKELHQKNEEELTRLRKEHRKAMESLLAKQTEELEFKKKEILTEHSKMLSKMRQDLVEERVKEEGSLLSQKEKALEEIRRKIHKEQDEEEARLSEAKTDSLMNLKQTLQRESAKEESNFKEDLTRSLRDLRRELQDKQALEEDLLRTTAEKELKAMKENSQAELEHDKAALRKTFRDDLDKAKKELDQQLSDERLSMKSKLEEEIEVLRKELEGETAARMAKIKAEFDGKLSVETERLKKISEKKDKTEEELQEELDALLEQKRKETQEQHKSELNHLTESLKTELSRHEEEHRSSHRNKMADLKKEMEKEINKLKQKLAEEKDSLQTELQEKERAVEMKKVALSSLETEMEEKRKSLEEERLALRVEEDKLHKEQERVKSLQQATLKQVEEMVRAEKKEMSDSIAKGREALEEIQRSHSNVKMEVEQLQKQSAELSSSIQDVRSQEQSVQVSLKQAQDEEESLLTSLNKIREEKESVVMSLKKMKDEEEEYLLSLKKRKEEGELSLQSLKKVKEEEAAARSSLQQVREAVRKKEDELKKMKKRIAKSGQQEHKKGPPPVTTGVQTDSAPLEGLNLENMTRTDAVVGVFREGVSPDLSHMTSSTTDMTPSDTVGDEDEEGVAALLDYTDLTGDTVSPTHRFSGFPSAVLNDTTRRTVPSLQDAGPTPSHGDQRVMSQLSDVESPSLAETKEVVEKHRRVLAERKAALKKAEADLKKDLKKMSHGLKETTGDTSVIEDIQASLREEAKSIREVEGHLSTFDKLLLLKKNKLKDLQASLLSDEEFTSHASQLTPSPPLTKYSSPKTYMKNLQEKMAADMRTRGGRRSKGVKSHRSKYSSTESSGVSSTTTVSSLTDSEIESAVFPHPHLGKGKAPSKHRSHTADTQSDILTRSIEQINLRLWQVLDRLNEQTEFSQLQSLARQGLQPPPTAHPSHLLNTPAHSGQRWAEPVSRHFVKSSQNTSEDLLPSKWKNHSVAYASTPLVAPQSTDVHRSVSFVKYDTPPQRSTLSTEDRLRKEKDWLREFRKDMALSSSRRSQQRTSLSTSKFSPNTAHNGHPEGVMQLVVDKHNNIQLLTS